MVAIGSTTIVVGKIRVELCAGLIQYLLKCSTVASSFRADFHQNCIDEP
jgi:hypothetical protein